MIVEKQMNNPEAIITVNEIRSILSDFQIGKKPLAKLLGWGETTIIRYIEGDVPTSEYSNKLRKIADEPAYYYELLLKNKNNLTGVAYRKSKKAVLGKLMETKISLIAQYMVHIIEGDVSSNYIQNLLYYAQAFSLALYEQELFEDEYCVNNDSKPFAKIFDSTKNNEINLQELIDGRLTEVELTLIQKVVESFSWYGPKALKLLNVTERANCRISRDKESNRIIAKEIIKNYFKELLVKFDIQSVNEIYKYPDIRVEELKSQEF